MAMARRDAKLDSRSARLKLLPRQEPYWSQLAPGQALGYHRPASRGAGSWWVKYRNAENKTRRKQSLCTADDFEDANGVTTFNFVQAQAQAREWLLQAHEDATGEIIHRGRFTVADALKAYRIDAERRGLKGLTGMDHQIKLHILPIFGHIEVAKLTQLRIERWHENMANTPARYRGKAGQGTLFRPEPSTNDERRARKSTANRILTTLKAALNFAKRRRLVTTSADAWREVRPFKGTTSCRTRFLSPEESRRLVNGANPSFRGLIIAALFTGCRVGELARLQVRDFDPGNGTVFIAESKSGKSRHIVLTAEGQAFFKSVTLARLASSLIFERESHTTRNCRSPKIIRGWKRSEQSREMAIACKAAGLELVAFHELRHTYASALVNVGVPLAFIAEQLGHSGTRMVELHYGHLSPSAKADAIRKLSPKLGIYFATNVEELSLGKSS